jgi:hypothetical protein
VAGIVERDVAARFNPARMAGAEARSWRRSATTERQASGGARDWKGARRVEKELVAMKLACFTGPAANGSGSCGACGNSEVAAR